MQCIEMCTDVYKQIIWSFQCIHKSVFSLANKRLCLSHTVYTKIKGLTCTLSILTFFVKTLLSLAYPYPDLLNCFAPLDTFVHSPKKQFSLFSVSIPRDFVVVLVPSVNLSSGSDLMVKNLSFILRISLFGVKQLYIMFKMR